MANPEAARTRALELFRYLDLLEEPEALLMPILLDAITMIETYRRTRHQVLHLPELTKSLDALLRELEITERINNWETEARANDP